MKNVSKTTEFALHLSLLLLIYKVCLICTYRQNFKTALIATESNYIYNTPLGNLRVNF